MSTAETTKRRGRPPITEAAFRKRLKAVHGNKLHLVGPYTNIYTKTTFRCHNLHHSDVVPYHLVRAGTVKPGGCPKCSALPGAPHRKIAGIKAQKTHHSYVCDLIRAGRSIFPLERYSGHRVSIWHTCSQDHAFRATPDSVLIGDRRCPHCDTSKSYYSLAALQWLSYTEKKLRIKIQHAKKGGEFHVPGTKYRVDGYNARSKTIFEFYGDAYHGNPNVYYPDARCNPWSKLTARELYRKTKKRERELTKLGYKLITIWESDWNKIKKTTRVAYDLKLS